MSDSAEADPVPFGMDVTDDGWQVAHLTGEADFAAMDRLQETLTLHLVPGQRVVLDLAGVTLMDASCLGVLESAHSVLAASGGSLTVRNPSRTAHLLLTGSATSNRFAIDIG